MTSSPSRPLTIVQVATNLEAWGGLELHLLTLADQLRSRGHRVLVAGRPGKFVLTRAQAMGLETFEATVKRQSDWTDFGRLRDFFRREKVEVIHAHNQEDALVPAAAARLAGVPASFLTWHLPFPFRNRARGRFILAFLHKRLIAISDSVRDMHLANGVAPGRMEVIHHGTDVEALRALTDDVPALRPKLGLTPGDIAVGIVGRVAPEKGHRELFEALRLLADRHPCLRAVVVGNGPDMPALRRDLSALGVAKKVIFTGFRDDVNNVIAALDIVAVPSIWPEPCSPAILQAMALGKPVVASRVGGTPELVTDGETGLLVPVSEPAAFAAALSRLAAAPCLRHDMGEAGRARAAVHFSIGRMVDRIEALYRRESDKAPR